jgi:hypothetical protein
VTGTTIVIPAGKVIPGDFLHWSNELYRVTLVRLNGGSPFRAATVDFVTINPHGGDRHLHFWADDEVTVTRP